MSIELRHLRAFIAVAEELNFRRASERLPLAQPALSRTIRDMEAILGIWLFERSTRVVQLTPAAQSLLPEAREMLDHLAAAIRNAQRVESGDIGSLVVGFNDFTINDALPAIVMRFRGLYPETSVDLRSMTSPEMAEALRKRRLDIGFLTGAHLVTDLASFVIRHERLVCLLPRGHPLASRSSVSLASLAREPFVMGAAGPWRIFLDVVNAVCMQAGFRPRIVQEAVNSDGIVNLVAAGVGVSIYVDARWVKTRRDVVVRSFVEATPIVSSVAAYHPELKSKTLENFIAVARNIVVASAGRESKIGAARNRRKRRSLSPRQTRSGSRRPAAD
jgi:DNA-binding transcriptional LysR family regulator